MILIKIISRIFFLNIKYFIVGGFNTILGLAAYPTLYFMFHNFNFNFHYMIILLFSQFFCVIFAFLMYKFAVFKTNGNYIFEFLKFSIFYLIYLIPNLFLLPLLVDWAHIHPIIAQTLISIGIIVCGFFWHSKITFIDTKNLEKRNL